MKKRKNILIFLVDDDKMFLYSLSHWIKSQKKLNVEIRTFTSGEECLQKLHLLPDVIILDYDFSQSDGNRNGLSVLKSIDFRSPNTRTIILTSSKNADLKQKSYQNEAIAFINKSESAFEKIQILLEKIGKEIESEKENKSWFSNLFKI